MSQDRRFFERVFDGLQDSAEGKHVELHIKTRLGVTDEVATLVVQQGVEDGHLDLIDGSYSLSRSPKKRLSFTDMVASEEIIYNDTAGIYERVTLMINTLDRNYLFGELIDELTEKMPKEDPEVLRRTVWGIPKKRKYRKQLVVGIAKANDGAQHQFMGPKKLQLVSSQ